MPTVPCLVYVWIDVHTYVYQLPTSKFFASYITATSSNSPENKSNLQFSSGAKMEYISSVCLNNTRSKDWK